MTGANRPIPLSLRAYAGLTRLSAPMTKLLMQRRLAQGKEDPDRIQERRGITSVARPTGPLVWIHAASVGEFLSLGPLVAHIRAEGVAVVVTTVTRTSAVLAAARLPEGAIHQFMPWDIPEFVDRFLDHWKPDLAIFAESELWPNLVLRSASRGIALIQVNGRMSERSFRGWKRAPSVIAALLSCFELSLAQTAVDADRLRTLGAPRVETAGNLKFDVPALAVDPVAFQALSGAILDRKVLLAASTHEGEDAQVMAAHKQLAADHPSLLTIVAPRHPERGAAIADLVRQSGLTAERRSVGNVPGTMTSVYVADTIGEMGLFYRLATIALIGGSLVPHGGQNPIEPAKLGVPILTGPHTHNFALVYSEFTEARAVRVVENSGELALQASILLADPEALASQVRAANAVVDRLGGALDRTIAAITPYLFQIRSRARA